MFDSGSQNVHSYRESCVNMLGTGGEKNSSVIIRSTAPTVLHWTRPLDSAETMVAFRALTQFADALAQLSVHPQGICSHRSTSSTRWVS